MTATAMLPNGKPRYSVFNFSVRGHPEDLVQFDGRDVPRRLLQSMVARLNASTDASAGPESCWLWTASVATPGYGRLMCAGRVLQAHRASWELSAGREIPPGIQVLHRCDVRRCVNPAHLFLGTLQDNIDDMMRKGRHADCVGEKNPRARLTEREVREIRAAWDAGGVSVRELAEHFEIPRGTISTVVYRNSWKHLEAR